MDRSFYWLQDGAHHNIPIHLSGRPLVVKRLTQVQGTVRLIYFCLGGREPKLLGFRLCLPSISGFPCLLQLFPSWMVATPPDIKASVNKAVRGGHVSKQRYMFFFLD